MSWTLWVPDAFGYQIHSDRLKSRANLWKHSPLPSLVSEKKRIIDTTWPSVSRSAFLLLNAPPHNEEPLPAVVPSPLWTQFNREDHVGMGVIGVDPKKKNVDLEPDYQIVGAFKSAGLRLGSRTSDEVNASYRDVKGSSLLVVGGPKYNSVAAKLLLEAYNNRPPVTFLRDDVDKRSVLLDRCEKGRGIRVNNGQDSEDLYDEPGHRVGVLLAWWQANRTIVVIAGASSHATLDIAQELLVQSRLYVPESLAALTTPSLFIYNQREGIAWWRLGEPKPWGRPPGRPKKAKA